MQKQSNFAVTFRCQEEAKKKNLNKKILIIFFLVMCISIYIYKVPINNINMYVKYSSTRTRYMHA